MSYIDKELTIIKKRIDDLETENNNLKEIINNLESELSLFKMFPPRQPIFGPIKPFPCINKDMVTFPEDNKISEELKKILKERENKKQH